MEILTQFSIYLINKPGVLANITAALAKAKVNIVALALMDSGEHGTLRIVCNNRDKAREVLGTVHDRWTEGEVLALILPNKPGAFADVAAKLAAAHVNISYAYCTGGSPAGKTTAIFKITDVAKAQKVLQGQKKPKRKPAITKMKKSPK